MADLIYAHDLSIADRLVLKNLEDDIVRHASLEGNGEKADSDSDNAVSSSSSFLEIGSEAFDTSKRRDTAKTESPGLSSPGMCSPSLCRRGVV